MAEPGKAVRVMSVYAESKAAAHELRGFKHELMGSVEVIRFDCWAGCPSTTYLTEPSAERAHQRHQERALKGHRG